MLRTIRATLSLVLFSVPALASTFVVDASGGPGSQFTDIGAAIAAAQPGDVILVRNGTYPAFVTSKGLAIIGEGGVIVNGQIALVGVPAFERTALIRMSAQTVVVDSCDGPVILQDVHAARQFRTISSADVRCRGLDATAPAGPAAHAFTVESSRVEIVGSLLRAGDGITAPDPGGNGIRAYSSGRLFVVDTVTTGGAGSHSYVEQTQAGAGGDAIRIEGGSSLRIAGGSAVGGILGWCEAPICTSNCCFDGAGANGIHASNSTCTYSASTSVMGSDHFTCPHCFNFPDPPFGPFPGTQFTQATPDDPQLSTSGTPSAGQVVTFTVKGPPGAPARLWLGRGLFVASTPPVAVELLVPQARVFDLGLVPQSGTVTRSFVIPASAPVGFGFGAQAEVVLAGGEVRRTNSCPVIVR